MTDKRVSVKISPKPALHVPPESVGHGLPLAEDRPLLVLGNERNPELVVPPVVPSKNSLFGPRGACLVSARGPLWVCDTGHHRLLGWKSLPANDDTPADWLIGQTDFSREGRNGKQAVGAATLNVPTGICSVGNGLAVADAWNHRVLLWHTVPDGDNCAADLVLGQADFCGSEPNRDRESPDADTLFWPYGVAFADGKLLVADTGNRRVLIWNQLPATNGQKADLVLGQTQFTSRDENAGGEPTAMSMRWPHDLACWNGRLCVADAGNNRILVWENWPDGSGLAADYILGQADDKSVDHNQSLYWPRQTSLNMPYGIAASSGWLYVADTANSRILGYQTSELSSACSASGLLGQPDFHAKGDNRWQQPCQDSLCWPYGIQAVDGLLVISDSGNNRISIWRTAS